MNPMPPTSRRAVIKSSLFGTIAVALPNLVYARNIMLEPSAPRNKVFYRYPSIDDEIVAEVVGASHGNFTRVKELVDKRPELSRATWDWAFGDWETALGAASHVGRRDIAAYLMEKGARPDIFTYTMLGDYDAVKAMIEATPGIQSIAGPHGISLLQHARIGQRAENLSEAQRNKGTKLVAYLESLGNAERNMKLIELDADEKILYTGDYKYGEGETEGLSVKLNSRNLFSLGKLGKFGGSLYQEQKGEFFYNGITSVKITFEKEAGKVVSLTVYEPDLTLKAIRV